MLFKIEEELKSIKAIQYQDISKSYSKKEKHLEELLKTMIGEELFPEYLVFGNERAWQKEADLFALDHDANLVIFELKVDGMYDRSKVMQSLEYAQLFSKWDFDKMNEHYRKCYKNSKIDLLECFDQHFEECIDKSNFNRKQKIIIISNASDLSINAATQYWRDQGIDIQEYYYRFYKISSEDILEISTDLHTPSDSGHCWINTNLTYYPKAYLDMIKNSKVAAYGSRAKLIDSRMIKAYVFLYHNGYGIIAAGKGTKQIEEKESHEFEVGEKEINIHLKDFIHGVNKETGEIENRIVPQEIKELLGQQFYFATSKVSLSQENAEKLYEKCKEEFRY